MTKPDRYNGTNPKQRKMARAVAADVLLQLKKRSMNITPGCYLRHPNLEILSGDFGGKGPVDIKTAPKKVLKECKVCAKGAMFLSRALLFNKYTFADDPEETSSVDFGLFNANLIESAFEQRVMSSFGPLVPYAVSFGAMHVNPRKRLKAIMENVLENHGVFRPDKTAK